MMNTYKRQLERQKADAYSIPTEDPDDVAREAAQVREDELDSWIQARDAERRESNRKNLTAVFIDIDGVIRNLTRYLADRFGVNFDTITKGELDHLFGSCLSSLDAVELNNVYYSAPLFDGAASWIRELSKDESLDVYIVSASGFNEVTKKATEDFLTKHGLANQDVTLCESTDAKVAVINKLGEQYGHVVVIDDYERVLSSIEIANARCILITHFPWLTIKEGRETSADIASLII